MKTLKLTLGDESHVVIENDASQKDHSLFAPQYNQVFKMISRLLPVCCDDKSDEDAKNNLNRSELVSNNIFAFVGNRGTGKSSCMLSVASMLRRGGIPEIKKTCHVIDVIDPSFFDEDVNILDIVIGRLFLAFKSQLKKRPSIDEDEIFQNNKRQLFSAFQEVRECLSNIECKQENLADSVEYLGNLASSVSLQESMRKLINKYLIFNNQDVLIIPIDDIDLHTKCAFMMVEQIRKYLVQKNVIVLLAAKMEQLRTVIENEYTYEYQKSIEQKWVTHEYISDMAARYLIKFIPQNQRVFMPDMDAQMDSSVEFYRDGKRVWPENGVNISLKYAVTQLIFVKTRYLFYHSKGVTSPIVPHNLRELRHLLGLLLNMPDYWLGNVKHDENKIAFKHFLFESWVPNNLDASGQKSIRELESLYDATTFNKSVLLDLKERFIPIDGNTEFGPKWFLDIYDERIRYFNISIGDVFSVISYIKNRGVDGFDALYLFAIETLYSIKLYEYYDLMTEKESSSNVNMIDDTIKRRSMFDDDEPYHILVAGGFSNSMAVEFIPQTQRRVSRSIVQIKLSKVKGWYETYKSNPTEISYLHALEWIMLFISHRDYEGSKEKDVSTNFRCANESVYKEPLYNIDNVIFDVNSLFFNITCIKQAYNRIDEAFYEQARNNNDSLLNKLLYQAEKRRSDKNMSADHKLLSWCCIRNAEILDDLTGFLSRNMKSSSIWLNNYKNFLKRVSNYYIKTYDKDDGIPYAISFDYANILLEALNDGKVESLISELFSEEVDRAINGLSSDMINIILTRVENLPRNAYNRIASGIIKDVIKSIVPTLPEECYENLFPARKSFKKEEIEIKLQTIKA